MRTRLWTEMAQAKHNVEFLSVYADRQRTLLRYFNIAILAFSTSGVMGYKFWEGFPVAACIIIAIVSLLRLMQPHIIMTEKQIGNIDAACNFYGAYYNKLEQLWYDSEQGFVESVLLKDKFFEIKNSEASINILVNETIRTKPARVITKAKAHADQYFLQTFNTKTR